MTIKKYLITPPEEREKKKIIAQKIIDLVDKKKIKWGSVKEIINTCGARITGIRQMCLSKFSADELEGFLNKLNEEVRGG